MAERRFAVVVLAAGLGTRMKSKLPKVLHPVGGAAMIDHVLGTVGRLGADEIVVVVGPEMTDFRGDFAPATSVVQEQRLGTADAVKTARDRLAGFDGDVLVAYGDSPLVRPETYRAILDTRHDGRDPAVAVLGFRPQDPSDYGRLIVDQDGNLQAIVETRDANAEQREITLCNSGLMAIDGRRLFPLLDEIDNDNAKREYYLTDVVGAARRSGHDCAYIEGADDVELIGVNARSDLAVAEAVFQTRARAEAMASGVTMIDPTTCYLSYDTRLGFDVTIEPNVCFGPGVVVGDNVRIHAFCHIEGAQIGDDVTVGPFARIRPGTELGQAVRVGNFVEIKNAQLEHGAKTNHLSYVGDASVGEGANVGAGTITCNYDGVAKNRTEIGAGAFIGSNTALVAPVKIGAGAVIGAGSVITKDVADGAIASTRPPQREIAGAASKLRERNRHRAAGTKRSQNKGKA